MALPSITWATVTAIAPRLSTVPLASQTAILGQVDRRVAAPEWGALYADAKAYLAAHLGALYQRGAAGGVGPVSSMTVGPTSVHFATPALGATGDSLLSTSWGQEYLRLRNSIAAFRLVTA